MGELETPEFLRARSTSSGPRVGPALLGRLGARDVHAVPVDEAGRLALGRHPQRHDRALAQRHRRPRAGCATSSPTSSTSPRPSSKPRGCLQPTPSTASPQAPMRGRQHDLHASRREAAGSHEDAVLRDLRQPRHLPPRLDGGHRSTARLGETASTPASRSTTTSGSSTTPRPIGRRPATSQPRTRACCTHLQRLWLIEATRTTCCRWTTAPRSGQPEACRTPRWSGQQADPVAGHGSASSRTRRQRQNRASP